MKKTSKLLALLLACIMIATLAACGGSSDSGTVSGGTTDSSSNGGGGDAAAPVRDTFNVAVAMDSGTLHPFGVSGAGGFPSVLNTCYEGLFYYLANGTRVWVLATSIDRITDIHYTMNIRQGVTFANGNTMNAEDVMFSMELCLNDPRNALNVKGIDFEKTKVTDEYTIDLWYTEFNAAADPGFASMYVFDKDTYDEQDLALNPNGTGPYVITDYVVNSHVIAEAREGYWGDPPAIKRIHFKVINEEAQRVNALETGDVDTAAIPLKDAAFVESLGYDVVDLNAGIALVTYFNLTEGTLLGTKEARYAIAHAIDRQAIVNVVYDGRSKVLDWPISESLIDYEPRFANMHEIYSIGHNPERAKALAEQSGIVGETLRLITNGSSDYITIAEIIQADLLEIGVNTEIINYDQATYFAILMDESNYEIAIFNPAAPSVMACDILAMYLTFIPQGWHGASRDRYGELSMAALAETDDKTRGDMIYEYLPLFLEYSPWFGLVEGVSMRANAKDLRGLEYTLAGGFTFSKVYFAS